MTDVRKTGEALDAMLSLRSSVRCFDTEKSVPEEDEKRIVEAAQRTSTSSNLQSYSFISIKNPENRKKIAELSARQWFICDAGLFMLVCVDLHKVEHLTRLAGYKYGQGDLLESFLMAVIDAALAGQTASLMAEGLGYGICMIGGVRNNTDKIIELLSLPAKVFPVFGLCIGHPLKKNPPKPRLDLSGVLFTDRYDESCVDKAIRDYDRVMSGSGIYAGREFPLESVEKAGSRDGRIEKYGWIEHSARRVSTTNPEKTRFMLRGILEDRGFGFK